MNIFLFPPKKRVIFLVYTCFIALLNLKVYAEEPKHNWQNISPQVESIVYNYAPSSSHEGVVYALTGVNSLIKSVNNGATWTEVKTKGNIVFTIPSGHFGAIDRKGDMLRIDPADPQTLFTLNHGVLSKSSDGGVRWKKVSESLSLQSFFELNPQPLSSLLKALVSNSGEAPHLAISKDKGEHWIVAEHAFQPINNKNVEIEAIDPFNPEIIYARGYQKQIILYKSLDSGKTWNSISRIDSSEYRGGLKIHPINTNILYAKFEEDLSDAPVSIFGSVINNDFFDRDGYMRSEDGGENWERLGILEGLDDFIIGPLTLDPTDSSILYANLISQSDATLDHLVAKSKDAGRSWELIPIKVESNLTIASNSPLIVDPVQGVVVNPSDNHNLFYPSKLSPRVSFNGGGNWRKSATLFRERSHDAFVVAEKDPNIIYFYNSRILYKSIDAGFQWRTINENLSCEKIIINPQNNNNLLCTDYINLNDSETLKRSFDAGRSWELIDSFKSEGGEPFRKISNSINYANDGKTIYHILLDQDDFRSPFRQLLRKSLDNGNSWRTIEIPFLITRESFPTVLIDPINSQIVYAVSSDRNFVYKSITGGVFWIKQLDIESSFEGIQTSKLLLHPTRPDRLLYIAQASIIAGENDQELKAFITDDGGNNWMELSSSFTDFLKPNLIISSLVFNPANPLGVIASLYDDKLYETTDLGKTWNIIADDFKRDLFSVAGNVYSRDSVDRLTSFKSLNTQNCLFSWAEQHYPTLFGSDLGQTQFIENYVYRYYKDTNTYLGVFENTTMHLLQADITVEIRDVGFFDYFQRLSGCK